MGDGTLAAIVGLLGVVVGSLISKWEERRKTLLEIKQKNYSDWWELLYKTQKEASDIYYSKPKSELILEDEIKIGELFIGLSPKKNIILMYLAEEDGARFSKLVEEIGFWYSTGRSKGESFQKVENFLEDIRGIFRDSLRENIYQDIWKKIIRAKSKSR